MFTEMKPGDSRRFRDVHILKEKEDLWSVKHNGYPMPDGNGGVLTNVRAEVLIAWMISYV